MKLTKADKINLVKNLSASQKAKLKKHLIEHQMSGKGMSGSGFLDFLKKVGNTLLPVVKAVGMPILKEILVPLAKSKLGLGLKPSGGGLRLAGDRRPRKK